MKHAYLIMAHNEIEILKLLLLKLDDCKNDIYLHFDKKSKLDKTQIIGLCKYSKIYFIKRINVYWGGVSQIKCEMNLLKKAVKGNYDYYHFITGVDLPIKSNEEIDCYFEKNKNYEYISLDCLVTKEDFSWRYRRYHFYLGCPSKNTMVKFIFNCINKILKFFEKIANRIVKDRTKRYKNLVFMKGSSYFDITHNFAKYLLKNEKKIFKIFNFTKLCDEVFIQTIFYNSPFKDNLSSEYTRFIDWSKQGNSPEFLTLEHLEEIKKSNKLFARKFSSKLSKELIEKIL